MLVRLQGIGYVEKLLEYSVLAVEIGTSACAAADAFSPKFISAKTTEACQAVLDLD